MLNLINPSFGSLLGAIWQGMVDDTIRGLGLRKGNMQTIEKPGVYLSEWGPYQLQLDFFMTGKYWVGTVLYEGKPTDVSPHFENSVRAIEHIAAWLENKGCSAFVNGKVCKLKDFLAFTPARS